MIQVIIFVQNECQIAICNLNMYIKIISANNVLNDCEIELSNLSLKVLYELSKTQNQLKPERKVTYSYLL